jgi:DNA-binding CsgD family transcriptional regulator
VTRTPGHYKTATKHDLSKRQREVLDLVAAGRTNGEIAERLGITLDGAKWHVSEILGKLEVSSREEAAEWWRRERRRPGARLGSLARGLIPAWWWKAGAGVGAAAVVGAVGLVVFGSGSGPGASAEDWPQCPPEHLTTELRAYPGGDGSVLVQSTFTAIERCQLDGFTYLWQLTTEPTAHRAALDAGDSHTATWRWTNWCDGRGSIPISARFYANGAPHLLFGGGNGGSSLTAPTPACTDAAARSVITVWNGASGGSPGPGSEPPAWCRAEDIQGRAAWASDGDGVRLALLVSSERPCSLRGSAWASVAANNGWVRDVSSGEVTLDRDLDGQSEVAIAAAEWPNWCWRDGAPGLFAYGNLQAADSRLSVGFTVPMGPAPACPTSVPQAIDWTDWCGGVTGCDAANAILPDVSPSLDALMSRPASAAGEFRIRDGASTGMVSAAAFEAAMRPLLAGGLNVVALGCSDKDGPGTCVALSVVFERGVDGTAFSLDFVVTDGEPPRLSGATLGISLAGIESRREASFGSVNYTRVGFADLDGLRR